MSHCANWNLALVKKEIPKVANSCSRQMSACPSLILQKKKTFSLLHSIFTEQWEVQFSLEGQGSSLHHLQSRIPEPGRSWGG